MSSTTLRRRTVVSLSVVIAAAAIPASAVALGSNDDGTARAAAATQPRTAAAEAPNTFDAVLEAVQMPRVNEMQRWGQVDDESQFVSFPYFDDLGGTDSARQSFALPGARATNIVFTFPDHAAAKAAYHRVLGVTRSSLAANLPTGGGLLYGPHELLQVPVVTGRAAYTQLTWRDDPTSEEGWFEWLGATQRGHMLSVVLWRVSGQDASYEVDPTIAALVAANRALGALG